MMFSRAFEKIALPVMGLARGAASWVGKGVKRPSVQRAMKSTAVRGAGAGAALGALGGATSRDSEGRSGGFSGAFRGAIGGGLAGGAAGAAAPLARVGYQGGKRAWMKSPTQPPGQ